MVTTELSAIQRNAAESQRLAQAMAEFQHRGGKVAQVAGFTPSPTPRRTDWIDPETVLKRRPPAISRTERATLRRMADSL